MGLNLINLHVSKLQLFREVQKEFSKRYPFLKIEFQHRSDDSWVDSLPKGDTAAQVSAFLQQDIGLDDEMTVTELEWALKDWFGDPVRVLRKGGKVWIDTCHTGEWPLRKQNDQGREIAAGFQ
jgi:hypothetical protein